MMSPTELRIRLAPVVLKSKVGVARLNVVHGGPGALLCWLETQLGFSGPAIRKADRITEFAGIIDGTTGTLFDTSLATDRWATSAELLSRYDDLRVAGWNGDSRDSLPPLMRDLARVLAGKRFLFPDQAARLHNIRQALRDGQRLPPHRCILEDPIEQWPPVWQAILKELSVEQATKQQPTGKAGSALRAAQDVISGRPPPQITQDGSFRFVSTRSETAACEFVAATLARDSMHVPETVIYCENDLVALRLDACLHRWGVPTMGAAALTRAHPALQVLPLCLSLCWDPVDPQVLLDFLTLPVNPIPRAIAMKLAECLAEQPGLGSAVWEAAIVELCMAENDPEGKVRARIDSWLMCNRVPRGQPISSAAVRERCGLVAQWAAGRALLLLEEGDGERTELAEALQIAASHASALGELAESQGKSLTEPQLSRLLEEVKATGVSVAPFPEAVDGPVRVRTLAEIVTPFKRLIWLGLGSTDAVGCPWPVAELEQINAAGIALDDGSHALSAWRSAEATGFLQIQESLLAILLPQDLTQRWHPFWLAIRTKLEDRDAPPVLDDLFVSGQRTAISPFEFESAEYATIPPPMLRPLWHLPANLLQERSSVSASELQDRLGCPHKWVFKYQARLSPSPIAELPSDFLLRGTFCHSIFERLFGGGADLPTVEQAAIQVAQLFDERVALDAAPLAQPDQVLERRALRTELISATRLLVTTLAAGGYRISGIEVELTGEAFGKPLKGWIDCLAVRHDGQEAIIDFKYAGRSKYRELIRDGRAVQLATYAHGRSQGSGQYPAVAYLVLADAQLYTPTGSPLSGDGSRFVIDGPGIQTVWQKFSQSIAAADGWLTGGQPVPARPLQPPAQWPPGAELILDVNRPEDQPQEPCRYCDFGMLCGREGLR